MVNEAGMVGSTGFYDHGYSPFQEILIIFKDE